MLAAVLLACGTPYGGGIAPWPERVPIEPRTPCARAVVAGAPELGRRIDGMAVAVEAPSLDTAERAALAAQLRALVVDHLALVKDNRPDRQGLIRSVRGGATLLAQDRSPPPELAGSLRQLAREVPEEIPRDETYVAMRCPPRPARGRVLASDVIERSTATAATLGPAFVRAVECRKLAAPLPDWPWQEPRPEVQRALLACRDELAIVGERCRVDIESIVDAADRSAVSGIARLAGSLYETTRPDLAVGEATLVARRLLSPLEEVPPPLSTLPALASARAELAALPDHRAAADRSAALLRVQHALELVAYPCDLFRSVEGEVSCKLEGCRPPEPRLEAPASAHPR